MNTTTDSGLAGHGPPAPATMWGGTALRDEWERVCIERVELQRASACPSLAVVRATVHLGRLLPPEVCVELTWEEESEAPRATTTTERMWTAQSYDNGTFVFEAHAPGHCLVAARGIRVSVRSVGGAKPGTTHGADDDTVPRIQAVPVPRVHAPDLSPTDAGRLARDARQDVRESPDAPTAVRA